MRAVLGRRALVPLSTLPCEEAAGEGTTLAAAVPPGGSVAQVPRLPKESDRESCECSVQAVTDLGLASRQAVQPRLPGVLGSFF